MATRDVGKLGAGGAPNLKRMTKPKGWVSKCIRVPHGFPDPDQFSSWAPWISENTDGNCPKMRLSFQRIDFGLSFMILQTWLEDTNPRIQKAPHFFKLIPTRKGAVDFIRNKSNSNGELFAYLKAPLQIGTSFFVLVHLGCNHHAYSRVGPTLRATGGFCWSGEGGFRTGAENEHPQRLARWL